MKTLSEHFATVTIKKDTVEIELPSTEEANEFTLNTLANKTAGHDFLPLIERLSDTTMAYKRK